jgi:hypothetical protein
MKITLTKTHRSIALACATGDDRPLLTCLCVRNGWVVAADGFMLARMRHPYRGKQVLFPASFLKHFKRCEDVVFTVTPKRITGDTGTFSVSIPRPNLGTFLDHTIVVGDALKHTPGDHVAFSPHLMRRALAIHGLIDQCVSSKLSVYGVSEPMILRADVYDEALKRHIALELVVMPMFVQW